MMLFTIRYLISLKSNIIYILQKLKLIMILIKSVLNKDKNLYYDNIFLEKWLNQLAKK